MLAAAIRWGRVCRQCKTECNNPPTPNAPLWLPDATCDACKGDAEKRPTCRICRGRGWGRVDSCPKKMIPESAWEFVRACSFARKGVGLPESGGMNDQAMSFCDGLYLFERYENKAKAETKVVDDEEL